MPVRGVYVEEKDFFEDMAIYSKLQKEIMFEGFIWKDGGAVLDGENKSDGHIFIDEEYCRERTVECLLNEFNYRFKLTPAAWKLIYPDQ